MEQNKHKFKVGDLVKVKLDIFWPSKSPCADYYKHKTGRVLRINLLNNYEIDIPSFYYGRSFSVFGENEIYLVSEVQLMLFEL